MTLGYVGGDCENVTTQKARRSAQLDAFVRCYLAAAHADHTFSV